MRQIGFVLLTFVLIGAASPGAPTITDLKPIALHPGINRVPGFMPGGGTATIAQAYRGNGNAHGYTVWMVLGGISEIGSVGVVGVEGSSDKPVEETITDAPFDGERVLGAVRFATGRLAGKSATLLIHAALDFAPGRPLADHETAVVRWYRLDHEDEAIGRTTDEFVSIGEVRTTKHYCNAELALRDVAGIPLPRDFAGANRADGCFPDR